MLSFSGREDKCNNTAEHVCQSLQIGVTIKVNAKWESDLCVCVCVFADHTCSSDSSTLCPIDCVCMPGHLWIYPWRYLVWCFLILDNVTYLHMVHTLTHNCEVLACLVFLGSPQCALFCRREKETKRRWSVCLRCAPMFHANGKRTAPGDMKREMVLTQLSGPVHIRHALYQ